MKQIFMPKYGATMVSGEVTQWLVKEGDTIQKGDPIAEISSEKLTNTLEALESGKIVKILVQEGEEAECGEPILELE